MIVPFDTCRRDTKREERTMTDLPDSVTSIFSKSKGIAVRDRRDIEVVYTYAIRYNLGSEDDTVILDTSTFSYEEAVFAATQLIEMDHVKGMIGLSGCSVLDIELMEVHIHYD